MAERRKDTDKWHLRYLEMAALVAGWSKHPDFQVGAIAVGEYGQVLSTGYNGWPRSISGEAKGRQLVRSNDPSLTIHAETNVIYNASLTGVSLARSVVYVYPMFPCIDCAKALVQVGVSQICYKETIDMDGAEKWRSSWAWAGELFREAGVMVTRVNG
jgi:dCMP deaminase